MINAEVKELEGENEKEILREEKDGTKSGKTTEILPMSSLIDRLLNYESRDTDDLVSLKDEEMKTKIQMKNGLFDESLQYEKGNIEKNEIEKKRIKDTRNGRSAKDFENFFSPTNGLRRNANVDRMTYESPSVSAGDVSEVDGEVEAEVIAAYRHAASISFIKSSDIEDENEDKITNKVEHEGEVESGGEKKCVNKVEVQNNGGLSEINQINAVADVSLRSADQSSSSSAVTTAVVHYHAVSPLRSPKRSPSHSPSSSSPSSPTDHSRDRNTTFNSTTEEQSIHDSNAKEKEVGVTGMMKVSSALNPQVHDIFEMKKNLHSNDEFNSVLVEKNRLTSNSDDKGISKVSNEKVDDFVSDAGKKRKESDRISEMTENKIFEKDKIKKEYVREFDRNDLKLFEKMMDDFKIDEKLINFDFNTTFNDSQNSRSKKLDGEIKDFDDDNPLEALLNLHERHLLQEKLHSKQQGNLKNQQMELLKLKKVVAIKLMEKERENENLKILRNELLFQNQIEMEMPSSFVESDSSESKIPNLVISSNSSELDGTSEMKELSSLTTPNQNYYKNNNNNKSHNVTNSINKKNSRSADAPYNDNKFKNIDKNNKKLIDSRISRASSDNSKQKGVKTNQNSNKNFKNKYVPEDILDDPYQKIPCVPKERSFRVERSLEYLSPKERSIRNSQMKKSESDRLLMTLEKAKNIPQHQDIPIADHIKV